MQAAAWSDIRPAWLLANQVLGQYQASLASCSFPSFHESSMSSEGTSFIWCLVLQVRNEATCQRPYAREGKWIRGEKAVNQTPRCSYWVISRPLHHERRVPVFHAPSWSFTVGHERRVPDGGILSRYFTVGHERRVPEDGIFFNADKDLHQPLSLLSFVLYLPAEGQTPTPARGKCDA